LKSEHSCHSRKCKKFLVDLYAELEQIDYTEKEKAKHALTVNQLTTLRNRYGIKGYLYWLKAKLCLYLGQNRKLNFPIEVVYWDLAPAIGDVGGEEWTVFAIEKKLLSGLSYEIYTDQSY
jgi:hypothetical protein